MLEYQHAFSGFSVNNLADAEKFYKEVIGLPTKNDKMGLRLVLSGTEVFIYHKDDHRPASFTVLNIIVDNIADTVTGLSNAGVTFEQYDWGNGAATDKNGIMHGKDVKRGPDIAWFKDPSGNVVSIISS